MPANVLEMLIKAGEAERTRGAHRHVGVPRYFPRGCRYCTIEERLLPPDEQSAGNYLTDCHCFASFLKLMRTKRVISVQLHGGSEEWQSSFASSIAEKTGTL